MLQSIFAPDLTASAIKARMRALVPSGRAQLLAGTALAFATSIAFSQTLTLEDTDYQSVDGATNIRRNSDGSLSFQTPNGETIVADSGEWIISDGVVYLREDIYLAEIGNVGGGAGLGAGALWGGLGALALLGVAGGGGGGGGSSSTPSLATTQSAANNDYQSVRQDSALVGGNVVSNDNPPAPTAGAAVREYQLQGDTQSASDPSASSSSGSTPEVSVQSTGGKWLKIVSDFGTFYLNAEDGTYYYEPDSTATLPADGEVTDTFTYAIVDLDAAGNELATVDTATVTFTLREAGFSNTSATVKADVDATQTDEDTAVQGNLSDYFDGLVFDPTGGPDGNIDTLDTVLVKDTDGDVVVFIPGAGEVSTQSGIFYTLTTALGGTVVLNSVTGEYKYTPPQDYSGSDSFTILASDGLDDTSALSAATVNISITAVNDAPVVTSSVTGEVFESGDTVSVTEAVSGGDGLSLVTYANIAVTDVDSTAYTLTLSAMPGSGSLIVEAVDGTVLDLAVAPGWQLAFNEMRSSYSIAMAPKPPC